MAICARPVGTLWAICFRLGRSIAAAIGIHADGLDYSRSAAVDTGPPAGGQIKPGALGHADSIRVVASGRATRLNAQAVSNRI